MHRWLRSGAAVCWLLLLAACGAVAAPTPAATNTRAALATLQPTAAPPPSAQPLTPTPLVLQLAWAGYTAYVVQPGDTLEQISTLGGSAPVLIERYNHLDQPPQPGQPLIIPLLPGHTSALSSTPVVIKRGPTTAQQRVALTFDAGAASDQAPALLDALQAANVHVTFFLTGAWIQANPQLVRRMRADGHELANHTSTHPDLTTLSSAEVTAQLTQTEQALVELFGPEASLRPFMRPPYGAINAQVVTTTAAQGYLPVLWTLDSLDSVGEPKSPEFLIERVLNTLPPEELNGAIILLHIGNPSTITAVPTILQQLDARGYTVVPLSQLWGP